MLQRVDALDRELKEVEAAFEEFKAKDLAEFNATLQQAKLPPVTVATITFDPDEQPRGGRLSALASGLVGLHFYGDIGAIEGRGERE
jgi:hypothetical protein